VREGGKISATKKSEQMLVVHAPNTKRLSRPSGYSARALDSGYSASMSRIIGKTPCSGRPQCLAPNPVSAPLKKKIIERNRLSCSSRRLCLDSLFESDTARRYPPTSSALSITLILILYHYSAVRQGCNGAVASCRPCLPPPPLTAGSAHSLGRPGQHARRRAVAPPRDPPHVDLSKSLPYWAGCARRSQSERKG
jgi:hypothetical protein